MGRTASTVRRFPDGFCTAQRRKKLARWDPPCVKRIPIKSLLVVLNTGFTWISQLNGPPLYGTGFATALLCAPPLGARRLAWHLGAQGYDPIWGSPPPAAAGAGSPSPPPARGP